LARKTLILIEGSTGNGLRYVQSATRLGLHTITLSSDPTQYDYLAAEGIEAVRVDTDDFGALVRECSRIRGSYDIAGITGFATPDEWVYATVSKLCQHFGLPGPNPESIERCCDKSIQREVLARAGIPIPDFRVATSAMEVESHAAEIGLPVVLKPAVGLGSSGVRLCRSVDEVVDHTTYLLGGKHTWRFSPRVLIEQFAQGPHYYAQTFGNEVLGIGDAEFGPPPHFVYQESTFPAPLTDEEYQRITDVSLSCLRALGLGWGPTTIEFRWTKRGPVVIEVNPRLGGAPGPQLVRAAFGIDLITEHIKLVIGEKSDLRRMHSQTAVARDLLADCDGVVASVRGNHGATAVPGVTEVKLYIKPGMSIVRSGDYRDALGYVVAASPDIEQTRDILQRALNLIDWSITPSLLSAKGNKQ